MAMQLVVFVGVVMACLLPAAGVAPEQRPMCQMGCIRRGVNDQEKCLSRCSAPYAAKIQKAHAAKEAAKAAAKTVKAAAAAPSVGLRGARAPLATPSMTNVTNVTKVSTKVRAWTAVRVKKARRVPGSRPLVSRH